MRINCPFCGSRDIQEFVYRGDATPKRPEVADGDYYNYLYLRDNVAGEMNEHWYHSGGCRSWLIVRRNTRTHEILGARLAQDPIL